MEARRRVLATLWLVMVATALIGGLAHEPVAVACAWLVGIVVLPFTGALAAARAEERLELPVAYRAVAAIAFAVPLAGALLVEAPDPSGESYLFAPYFVIMALLGYRVLVARGPRRVLRTTVVSLLAWPPLGVFLFMGCRLQGFVPPPPHWTAIATERLLLLTQVVNGALCAVALLAFAPRHELVPEARVHA